MKKKLLVAFMAIAVLAVVGACKEKNCHCTSVRAGEVPAHSLEPLGNHKNCSELDRQWTASDSSQDMLKKTCVEAE
ncbi:MAG: hypothetical protein IJ785_04435 [Bacteroidales bacterium]|nr:hypothetical protein [Bacteroidales bacterium]